MSSQEQRAARRRAEWSGEVVTYDASKGRLYESLSFEERLAALARLNRRAWIAAHGAMPPPLPRAAWPGEIFELRKRG